MPHVVRLAADEAIIMIGRYRLNYLWHHYHECLAMLKVPRTPELDEALGLDELEAQYTFALQGIAHGTPLKDASMKLGEPDAIRTYQAMGYLTHYHFADNITIDYWQQRVKRVSQGVPAEVIKRTAPFPVRYRDNGTVK